MNCRIGLSTSIIDEKLFAEYQENQISAMEISCGREQCESLDYKLLLELSKKYGLELWSFHLPFLPFTELDISFISKEQRAYTVQYHKSLIDRAADIGIDKFIIHSSGEPIVDNERSERLKLAQESLFELAVHAEKSNSVICVEDLPRSCIGRDSNEINELISVHPKLMVCFDTNHLLTEKPIDFIKAVGNRIVTMHVSDYDFVNERHWLPGEGDIDWNSLTDALDALPYNGVWMYEISFQCPKTIIRDRSLTCKDFYINATELFNKQKPTTFSTHKKNLGMWE